MLSFNSPRYCNSHYTRHLLGLHALPLALSGQRYDAATASLSFSPRRDHHGASDTAASGSRPAPEQWAFFTPQGSGVVQEMQEGGGDCVRVRLLVGSLPLQQLMIDGCEYLFRGREGVLLELRPLHPEDEAEVSIACAVPSCAQQ